MSDNPNEPLSEIAQSVSHGVIPSGAETPSVRASESGVETKGESLVAALERRINLTEGFMIGIVLVVSLGFIAAIFELGFIVHDDYVAKQEGYHSLIEKIHQQDLDIQELKLKYANRKK